MGELDIANMFCCLKIFDCKVADLSTRVQGTHMPLDLCFRKNLNREFALEFVSTFLRCAEGVQMAAMLMIFRIETGFALIRTIKLSFNIDFWKHETQQR